MTIAPRVLVATDFSDPSAEALTQGDAHARSMGGVLGVCHVAPPSEIHTFFPQKHATDASLEAALDRRLLALIGDKVTSATGRARDSFECFVERGTPYAEVVRRAETWGARVTVVGCHGHTNGSLGGTAEKVVRYAHCPVLVARPTAQRGLVLCATDLSAPSLPAIEAAVTEARLRDAKLVIMHVVDQGFPLANVGSSEGITPLVPSPELLHDLREAARAQIDVALGKLEARADLVIVEGRAADALLTYIEENRPELVVVGTRGRTGLARVFLGSVAEKVARAARASVLVVRLPS